MSLVAAATTFAFGSTASDIANLQTQIDSLKAKQGKINAHTANDNLKWSADFRTAYDNINYDMANGTSQKNDALLSMRLWLNMAYNPDANNVFMAQLSMNKAFGADFNPNMTGMRAYGKGSTFDWTSIGFTDIKALPLYLPPAPGHCCKSGLSFIKFRGFIL